MVEKNATKISKEEPSALEKPKEEKGEVSAQDKKGEKNDPKEETSNSTQITTLNPPKAEKVNEILPENESKTDIPNLPQNGTLLIPGDQNATEVENRGHLTIGNQNQTKTNEMNITSVEGKNQSLAKANERMDRNLNDEDYGDTKGPLFGEKEEFGYIETSTPSVNKGKEIGEMIDPSEQVTFSCGSKVSDHAYLPLVHLLLFLWLAILMYPKTKRFFNWMQKSIKTEKNICKSKKQKNCSPLF